MTFFSLLFASSILVASVVAPWGSLNSRANSSEARSRRGGRPSVEKWRVAIHDMTQMAFKYRNTFPVTDDLVVKFRPFDHSKDKYYRKLAKLLQSDGETAPKRKVILRCGEEIMRKMDLVYDEAAEQYAEMKKKKMRGGDAAGNASALRSAMHNFMKVKMELEEFVETVRVARSRHKHHQQDESFEFDRWND